MAKNRISRINDEIQRELSDLLRTVKDPRLHSTMVSITHVETTSDLRYAKIYISALDKSYEKDTLKGLKSAAGYLRRELGSRLKMRKCPELHFIPDTSIAYSAHINELLHEISRDKGPDGGPDENE